MPIPADLFSYPKEPEGRRNHQPPAAASAVDECASRAEEVMRRLYPLLVNLPILTLADGTQARVEPCAAPRINPQGDVECEFDVWLNSGIHLEFTLRNSGRGKRVLESHGHRRGSFERGE